MVYEFEELYIVGFVHMFIWWNKVCSLQFILFYISTLWYMIYWIWSIEIKCWIAYICIVINKVKIWSNSSHTVNFFFNKKIIALYFHTYLTIYKSFCTAKLKIGLATSFFIPNKPNQEKRKECSNAVGFWSFLDQTQPLHSK